MGKEPHNGWGVLILQIRKMEFRQNLNSVRKEDFSLGKPFLSIVLKEKFQSME